MLILKRTDLGYGPLTDDYAVLDESRRTVGRIYCAKNVAPGFPAWFWALTEKFPSTAADRGHAMSREAAMTAIKRRWLALSPERNGEEHAERL